MGVALLSHFVHPPLFVLSGLPGNAFSLIRLIDVVELFPPSREALYRLFFGPLTRSAPNFPNSPLVRQ